MTKQLYEEALADVKKVKEVAEANAQHAILQAVTPRIRDLIEKELLREHGEEGHGAPGSESYDGDLMTDDLAISPSVSDDAVVPASAITPPDEEGKITLDLDALNSDEAGASVGSPLMGEPLPDDEYEMNLESVIALSPVLKATRHGAAKEFELMVFRLGEAVTKFTKAGRLVRESVGFRSQITKMISRVEDMYDYVQESVTDTAKKSAYEIKLESFFRELNKLQEPTMSKKTKKMMNEEDVTLKLTGLPDDIDLDSVGVDLITGGVEGDEDKGDEDQGDEDLDLDGAEGSDEGDEGDVDLSDLDLGDDKDEEKMGETRRLSDDTIVEIDEGMLRREIARMRRLREETTLSADGNGVGSKEFDDFGDAKATRHLGEADEDLDEVDHDQLDEDDNQFDESDDDFNGSSTSVSSADKDNPKVRTESMKRRLAFESRLQTRAKARAASLKKEARKARYEKNVLKESRLKREYALLAKRFNESVKRASNVKGLFAEALRSNRLSQNGGSTRLAESHAVKNLRGKLAESNLINAKLIYTNKLLQNEFLSARQKAQVVEQLDSAKTVREAKLVYESLSRTLGNKSKSSINESNYRKVLGSSSRATRPASTQTLNEGYEADRWAKLAGINK